MITIIFSESEFLLVIFCFFSTTYYKSVYCYILLLIILRLNAATDSVYESLVDCWLFLLSAEPFFLPIDSERLSVRGDDASSVSSWSGANYSQLGNNSVVRDVSIGSIREVSQPWPFHLFNNILTFTNVFMCVCCWSIRLNFTRHFAIK